MYRRYFYADKKDMTDETYVSQNGFELGTWRVKKEPKWDHVQKGHDPNHLSHTVSEKEKQKLRDSVMSRRRRTRRVGGVRGAGRSGKGKSGGMRMPRFHRGGHDEER
jgi:hypothetical protein